MLPNNGGPGTSPGAAAVKGEMPMSRASRGEKRYRFILILLVSVAVLFVGNFLIFVKTDVWSAQAVKTIPGYYPFWVTHVENGMLPTSEKENQR